MQTRSAKALMGGLVALATGIALVGFPTIATARTQSETRLPVPKTYRSPLTAAQITQLSAGANDRVIILIRDEATDLLGGRLLIDRAAALHASEAPIVNELSKLHVQTLHAYSVINAVSATVSKAESERLATNPTVLAVVPDRQVTGPSSDRNLAPGIVQAAGMPAAVSSPGHTALCGTAAHPLVEPEALSLMHVVNSDGTRTTGSFDGTGVKVAVFPDGLDKNIPNFIRPHTTTSAIFDYEDFSGEGIRGTTGGEEAFGDASSIVAQGTHTYDLSGEVNPAFTTAGDNAGGSPTPIGSPCDVKIEGVAPGASLAVMKVFGSSNLAFNSEILQGLEYAVNTDHVNILSRVVRRQPRPEPGPGPHRGVRPAGHRRWRHGGREYRRRGHHEHDRVARYQLGGDQRGRLHVVPAVRPDLVLPLRAGFRRVGERQCIRLQQLRHR